MQRGSIPFRIARLLVLLPLAAGMLCGCEDACVADSDCPDGYFCQKDRGDCDGAGLCAQQPEVCAEIREPVCGCDGTTYSNACSAAAAGVSIDYAGACSTPGICTAAGECAAGEYCALDNCTAARGACTQKPGACTALWDPVCGCDGATYGNACSAAAAGVSVDYAGDCEGAAGRER